MRTSTAPGARRHFSASRTLAMVIWMSAAPAMATAQSAIAGVVTDPSGAVVPDVLVTVSSTALIEKFRRTFTDGSGAYRIEDLRPGLYTATFRRDGWAPYHVERIELAGAITTAVDASLAVD